MALRWPWTAAKDGPLPALLVALTIVTGLVDAVSYIALGHVFVANMTGNVVCVGFALAGAPGVSVPASLVAMASFLVGAVVGGRVAVRLSAHRARHLRTAAAISACLVLVAVLVTAIAGTPTAEGPRYAILVVLALAMGVQNATARRLAVPDLTTTVLTMTLTGIAADSKLAGGPGGHPARRLIAIAAMLTGALVGGLLVLHVDLALPLGIAAVLLAIVALVGHSHASGAPAWASPPG
jgi:uncharacterized membrane protein YoaK (UPF0700 family)